MTAGTRLSGVSRETRERLDIFERALTKWQRTINLVAPSTLADLRTRHVEDSLQVVRLAPETGDWVDLGSGAGLPGLIAAAAQPERIIHLVESDQRKCAFLRQAAHAMTVSARIWEGRIEHVVARIPRPVAVVTARALAPLPLLLSYAHPLLEQGAIGLFPKGRSHASELTEAAESWRFSAEVVPSITEPDGAIIRITSFDGRRA